MDGFEPQEWVETLWGPVDPVTGKLRPKFHVPFHTVASERFEKSAQSLMAYEMPIAQILSENSMKELRPEGEPLHIETLWGPVNRQTGKVTTGFRKMFEIMDNQKLQVSRAFIPQDLLDDIMRM